VSVTEAITALTAVGALVFTGLSLNATREQVAAAHQQNKVFEQGQLTDRYTKAVEQLDRAGHAHLQGRLGAIYALERLALDSPRDHPVIVEILAAFIRSNTPKPVLPRTTPPTCPAPQQLTLDTEAAFIVLSRRNRLHDKGTQLSLFDMCLNGVNLSGLNLRGAELMGTDLEGAFLVGTDLSGADLRWADLRGAKLSDATLSDAKLRGAYLRDADLSGADLRTGS
jgi:hypothetical protein